jgi:hypothetical protein
MHILSDEKTTAKTLTERLKMLSLAVTRFLAYWAL